MAAATAKPEAEGVTNTPLVSVVVPAYNAAPFIGAALDSALAQTYRPIEILVADDGSTDATAEVVKGYGPPVRYLREENKGPAGARNLGLRHAQGEFIAFLDADDLWHPRKLELQVPQLLKRPTVGLCACWLEGFRDAAEVRWKDLNGEVVAEPVTHRQIVLRNQFSTPTILARAEAVRQAGSFDETLFGPEDWDFWRRIMQHWEAVRLKVVLAAFRVRDVSVSSNAARMLENNLRVLRKTFADNPGLPWHCRQRARSYLHLDASWTYLNESAGKAAAEFAISLVLWPLPMGKVYCRPFGRAKLTTRIALELIGIHRAHPAESPPLDGSSKESG